MCLTHTISASGCQETQGEKEETSMKQECSSKTFDEHFWHSLEKARRRNGFLRVGRAQMVMRQPYKSIYIYTYTYTFCRVRI